MLPGSHRTVMQRYAFSALFNQEELPGSVTFGSGIPLPPGSAVICHSALLHGRRQRAGGIPSKPRYFTDVSYCQHSTDDRRWPSYQVVVRPNGRGDAAAPGGHADFCQLRLKHGLGNPNRGVVGRCRLEVGQPGEYAFLFDPSWFDVDDTAKLD